MPAATLPPATESNHLLHPREAAARLGVAYETLCVWRCTKRHTLPWVKIGRAVRYRPRDIERFIESRTVNPVELRAD